MVNVARLASLACLCILLLSSVSLPAVATSFERGEAAEDQSSRQFIAASFTIENARFEPRRFDPSAGETTTLYFELSREARRVKIKIYDSEHNLVRRIKMKGATEGLNQVEWDGTDDAGSIVAQGKYKAVIKAWSHDGEFAKAKARVKVSYPQEEIYIPHDPIYIEGDDDFTPANGVVGGSGTEDDPYIIEGWEIDAANSHGISIVNTTKYFAVRKVLVKNGKTVSYNGMYLENVQNGRIENTILKKNWIGIFLKYSSNITLTNNTVKSNESGIVLEYSDGNLLTNNTVKFNYFGIYLESSHNNILSDSVVDPNSYGIVLGSSNNNTLTNNVANSSAYGIYLAIAHNNTLTNNTVNFNVNGIYLWGSTGNLLDSNIVDSKEFGIYLEHSPNNTLNSNTTTYNRGVGVRVKFSDNTTLTNNIVNFNFYGILLELSDNNLLANNTANSNDQHGIDLLDSNGSILTNNIVENSGYSGIIIWFADNVILTNNVASFNGYYGIYSRGSYNNTLANNTLSSNSYGICFERTENNTFTGNIVSGNGEFGIYLLESSNNLIYNNYFNNTNNAYDDGNNTWNIDLTPGTNIVGGPYLGGNYWSDYTGADLDGDWIGDEDQNGDEPGLYGPGDEYPLLIPSANIAHL